MNLQEQISRMQSMMGAIKENTNKFDFIVGEKYEFEELPEPIQNDIEIQFDEYSELQPMDYYYVAKFLKPEEIEEYLMNTFNEYEIGDELEHPHMKRLIRDIKKNGLDYPAVGIEGNHRALAYWYLGEELPYLEMVKKDEEEYN